MNDDLYILLGKDNIRFNHVDTEQKLLSQLLTFF